MKHVGIEIKFYNLDTFKKQIDVNFIDLDSELVDLNYKVASLIFCHFWRGICRLLGRGMGSVAVVSSVAVWSSHLSTNRMRFCFFQSKCVVIVSTPFDFPSRGRL